MMYTQLARLISQSQPADSITTKWGKGTIELRLVDYLSPELPPDELITSVRAVLLRGDKVLVVQDQHNKQHILPGGRRDPGETVLQTLQREIGEETGWRIDNVRLLGFRHYHHLTPEPQDYSYIYPDFCQAVYVAQTAQYAPEAKIFDEYVLDTYFVPIADAQAIELTPGEQQYLAAATGQNIPIS